MNRCLSFMLFLLIASFSNAQNCLPSGITFTSQADVDAFPTNYPNCSEIDGTVIIGNIICFNNMPTDIDNLDSLSQLTNIHGSLRISFNPNLIDFSGLESLISVDGDLKITCNDNLINLSGLDNLVTVGGEVRVGSSSNNGNDKLKNLVGLSSLVNPYLYINNNQSFKNFSGLNTASSLQELWVLNCDSLENFIGLENITSINGLFEVSSIDNNFNFVGLQNLISIGGDFIIWENNNNNIFGLTSLSEIQGGLDISDCPNLSDINGFSSLTSAGSINIWSSSITSLSGLQNVSTLSMPNDFNSLVLFGNINLSDISDISSLDTTGLNSILITGNTMLSECAVEPVCNFIESNPAIGVITIDNNMAGCNSLADVEITCSVLPVKYSKELTARIIDYQTILKFSATQQINNSHFEIQHSIDGNSYVTIGELEGEGTTTKEVDFEFKHNSPIEGINYYRIKQVDFDGNFNYSNIASVKNKNETILLSPNPTFDKITIKGIYNKNSFIIYNSNGTVILEGHLEQDNKSIDVSQFEKGIYILKINNNLAKRFIKR